MNSSEQDKAGTTTDLSSAAITNKHELEGRSSLLAGCVCHVEKGKYFSKSARSGMQGNYVTGCDVSARPRKINQ